MTILDDAHELLESPWLTSKEIEHLKMLVTKLEATSDSLNKQLAHGEINRQVCKLQGRAAFRQQQKKLPVDKLPKLTFREKLSGSYPYIFIWVIAFCWFLVWADVSARQSMTDAVEEFPFIGMTFFTLAAAVLFLFPGIYRKLKQ
jgi:hypothetical protein